MGFVGEVIRWILDVYFYILIGRFLIELFIGLSRGARPVGVFLVIFEIIMTLTDPPLRLIRRFAKPVRVGPMALDFSWTILIFFDAILNNLTYYLPW